MMTSIVLLAILATTPAPIAKEAQVPRMFLVLNDGLLEIVDAKNVRASERSYRWDSETRRSIELIDGVEFWPGRDFWRMVRENEATYNAKAQLEVTKKNELLYQGKPVDVGIGVRHLMTALHWKEWVVAVGSVVEPKPTGSKEQWNRIKGSWYLIWFDTKSLMGSHQFLEHAGPPTLRIYTK